MCDELTSDKVVRVDWLGNLDAANYKEDYNISLFHAKKITMFPCFMQR